MQVVWEKRLVDCPAALLKNRLRHASYKKSNSSHEVRRGRRGGGRPLRRRASDNLISQSAMSSPLARLAADRARWNSDTGAGDVTQEDDRGTGVCVCVHTYSRVRAYRDR